MTCSWSWLPILMLSIASCSVGNNFVKPGADDLVLRKTSLKEALERYGTPQGEAEKLVKGHRVKTIKYYFSEPQATGWAHHPDTVPERSLSLEFVGDLLVSYVFHSTYERDHTDFDDSKVDQIKKGETPLQTVLQWLGEPHGRVVYPQTAQESESVTMYNYIQRQKSGNLLLITGKKILILKSGSDGKISDVAFSKSSNNR